MRWSEWIESFLHGQAIRAVIGTAVVVFCGTAWVAAKSPRKPDKLDLNQNANQERKIDSGKDIFRYDTFGDEAQWTDKLRMHEVIQNALDPVTALSLGLKVDVDALPVEVLGAIVSGEADLQSPETTLTLLEYDAVVGVIGTVEEIDGERQLTRVGITCALCHSTVDDSVMWGVGSRLDGWANVDLNPGAIIAASPAISEEARKIYNSWGAGRYDPRFNIDGLSTPVQIPPAYGLDHVDGATYTADGDVAYWNNYVSVTQMGGQGVFVDPRLDLSVIRTPDRVHRALPALVDYQLSLKIPAPPKGSFDPAMAERGEQVFHKVGCAECHIPPLYTDINLGRLHDPEDIGQDPAYAERTATKKYRTTPLRGLWQHAPYFHDGSAETLSDVVDHYDTVFSLELEDEESQSLVEFLKSL